MARNVHPALVDAAIAAADDLQSVYSQCVKLWFASTGRLDVGFNNKDMVAWIRKERPNIFDERGKKINHDTH